MFSIYSAELYAIKLALLHIPETHYHSHILFSDSMSSLQAIASKRIEHPIILDIFIHYNNLLSKNHNLIFCWIPSHTGIKGNSHADQEAKLALNSTVKPLPIPASDLKPYINQYISSEWQKLWNSFPNNKLYQSHPTINSISPLPSSFSRKDQTIINRLRIGHSRLTHLHLITKESPPLCSNCSCLLSIEHILCHCQAYQPIRCKYFSYASLSDIFSKTPKKQLLKFLTEIDICINYNYPPQA